MVSRGMQACETSSLVAVGSGIIADMVSTSTLGLLFIPSSIRLIVGSFIGGKYNNLVIKWEKNKLNDNESIQPEKSYSHILSFFRISWNFGIQIIFNTISTYLADSNRSKSASIIAVFHCIHLFVEACISVLEAPLEEYLGIK
ncbi:25135_t:CDS:2 [Gigaspora rosea]|nr:25135_t:CDS:2 [Gigaspora rosea]